MSQSWISTQEVHLPWFLFHLCCFCHTVKSSYLILQMNVWENPSKCNVSWLYITKCKMWFFSCRQDTGFHCLCMMWKSHLDIDYKEHRILLTQIYKEVFLHIFHIQTVSFVFQNSPWYCSSLGICQRLYLQTERQRCHFLIHLIITLSFPFSSFLISSLFPANCITCGFFFT